MSEQMTIKEAVDRIREAVEYYDMVHDTGDKVMTQINKDYVWKGYDYLIEYACKPINKENK
jgi:hypothetical protein